MGKLDGKVAIVTGAGRGIGAEIARKLAGDGAAVVVNDLDEGPAKEWGRYNVTVNTVSFGLIKTRLTEAAAAGDATIDVRGQQIKVGVNPGLLATLEQMIPPGRAGTPADAAGAVHLFCIPESDYVSAQTLICGGGFFG